MSRWGYSGPGEDVLREDGDAGFVGIDMESPAESLAAGWATMLINKRIENGVAMTRRGCAAAAQFNLETFGQILGHGTFKNPANGVQYLLIAVVDGVFAMREDTYPVKIGLPVGQSLVGAVVFEQVFQHVLMGRGIAKTLTWDGDLTGQFNFLPAPTLPTIAIPDTRVMLAVADRLLVVHNRDRVAVSDILEFNQYDAALFDFKVNAGDGDELTRVMRWVNRTVLLFKSNSVSGFFNVSGNMSDAYIDSISDVRGCVAPKSAVRIGGDVLFLSKGGVYRVLQVVQDRTDVADVSATEKIRPLMERVNWDAAACAAGAVLGKYYYLALPIDGSETNNVVVVMNTVSNAWESVDYYANENGVGAKAGLQILGFEEISWMGEPKLVMICNRANGLGSVLVHEYGQYDYVGGSRWHVIDQLRTRFYAIGSKYFKGFNRTRIGIQTWNPFISVAAIKPGVAERKGLDLIITRDRTAYFTHAREPYDSTNINDDANLEKREDYSVLPAAGGEWVRTGMWTEREQESIEALEIRELAESVAVEITGSQGRVGVKFVTVEGFEKQRDTKTKV